MNLNQNERLEDLQLGGLKIIQNENEYCFTSDSAILANFINCKKNDKCLEIGCGNGVISILVAYKFSPKKITAFEIQEEAANLAKKNVMLNNLENKIEIITSPIQNFKSFVNCESYDVVFSNPPYMKAYGNSLVNKNSSRAISRHELKLNLQELICCAGKLLKFGGRFCFIHKAERLSEIFNELKNFNLQPKKLLFITSSLTKSPNVVAIEAVKGGKTGLTILPILVANDSEGNYIFSIKKLLGEN